MATDPIDAPRLRLRPLAATDGDAALYRALYGDPVVMRHIAAPVPAGRIDRSFVDAVRDSNAQRPPNRWRIESRQGVARGLLGAFLSPDARSFELGLMLLPGAQGQGLGGEALAALAAHLDAVHAPASLWARHAPANAAMGRVLERCGFACTRRAPHAWRWTRTAAPALATCATAR